jgi:hydroxyacylglutathione hydrolase
MSFLTTIKALGDNLIYLYQYHQGSAFVVDPGTAEPVLQELRRQNLKLTDLLATHHHGDHTGGIARLKRATGCRVMGPAGSRIPAIDQVVADGNTIAINNVSIRATATPGHTRTSVCYYMEQSDSARSAIVWTGDTLFVGGCGRLFECDAGTMWQSLQKLAALPDDTLVYPGHDYAVENYEFALQFEPNNRRLRKRLDEIRSLQKKVSQTAASTILQERLTNPFLRAGEPEIKAALKMPDAEAVDVFAELRRRKDVF